MKVRTSNWLFGIMMIIIVGISLATTSCTDNMRAKSWGGEMSVNLPANQKVVTATWKDADLWILTRPMRAGEKSETYNFIEKSTFGVMEGEIIIIESGGGLKPTSYLTKPTPAEMDIRPIQKE